MERSFLKDQLVIADRLVAQGEEIVERQKALIAEYRTKGFNAAEAELLLARLKTTQAQHVAQRDALAQKLDLLN